MCRQRPARFHHVRPVSRLRARVATIIATGPTVCDRIRTIIIIDMVCSHGTFHLCYMNPSLDTISSSCSSERCRAGKCRDCNCAPPCFDATPGGALCGHECVITRVLYILMLYDRGEDGLQIGCLYVRSVTTSVIT